ncbi:GNAT family N-acetyltransferase [Bacillus sp. 03113]|uniref:GNAT family N-acetyltransferase n=1 Tax=Bacillus sp. 03113 TaxID=2578211 RepID=UPI001144EF89|nr:GNAT family N-acetyltransferase [Bacillus sp. 03113]
MKEIDSSIIHPSIRRLLSYATSEHKINLEYEKYIQLLRRKLYGFELKGEIVACIGTEFINSNSFKIKHIAVSPLHRGKGIGSKMIKFICNKYSMNIITAETDNDSVDFYRKYGFKIISLGERYPGVERFLCEYNF